MLAVDAQLLPYIVSMELCTVENTGGPLWQGWTICGIWSRGTSMTTNCCTHSHAHTQMHTHTHNTHAYTHTTQLTHTHTHTTHTHIYTHTHTQHTHTTHTHTEYLQRSAHFISNGLSS